ncbi:squalene/phytoene synthase family protein [Kovacikia minuta CCNUW1]|uniref:squalene/phytoene synthase family protein n=1 Tax=Kovacikia minuta TaxID=2931930 RepID=UPI001CCE0768|nr:squalene/phytoene synthase family protein [Kovacikia minuta]UBF28482.1 squalene/phytoene synthase family protein [Kovacikia minuta CCNUW1]
MNTSAISDLIGSSQYQAVADDSLKDEDNAAWVMELESRVKEEWIERISWIRLVDRLAENELVDSSSSEFRKFYTGWKELLTKGRIGSECTYRDVLISIRDRWFKDSTNSIHRLSIHSWDRFLEATARYHRSNLVIETLEQYTTMLEALSGSCFQVLPTLPEKYWQAAAAFGALDQFFNNLRDMREDAEQGICYLPAELLSEFEVSRDEILNLTACQNPNYTAMMRFWIDGYLPRLRQKTYDLMVAEDLPPSWEIWRDWSFHRYRRIERVFRGCQFNYSLFPHVYWYEVQRDLPFLLSQVRQELQSLAHEAAYHPAHSQEEFMIPEALLGIGKKAVNVVESVLNTFHCQNTRRIQPSEIY